MPDILLFEIVTIALSLGFTTGVYCLSYCAPFVLPYVLSEKRTMQRNVRDYIQFNAGRLVSYGIVGAFAGYLGERMANTMLEIIPKIGVFLLSFLLVDYALGYATPRLGFKLTNRWNAPALFGFFAGINLCPPFVLGVTYVLGLKSVVYGVIFMLSFYVANSAYLIPLFLLGNLGNRENIRETSRIVALIVGAAIFIRQLVVIMF